MDVAALQVDTEHSPDLAGCEVGGDSREAVCWRRRSRAWRLHPALPCWVEGLAKQERHTGPCHFRGAPCAPALRQHTRRVAVAQRMAGVGHDLQDLSKGPKLFSDTAAAAPDRVADLSSD